MLKKLYLFFVVIYYDYPVYRVRYNDSGETRPLTYSEASGCADVFGGSIFIDWDKAEYLHNYCK